MPHPSTFALIAIVIIAVGLVVALQNHRRRSKRLRARFQDLEGEEKRMFTFLNVLGGSIERDPSPAVLSRTIVDGAIDVVAARGGGIYFLSDDGLFLNPSYLSEDCPPLMGMPEAVREKAGTDHRALTSHLRLTRVAIDDGVLGHCLAVGEAIHIRDLKSHSSFKNSAAPPTDHVSALIAPLRHADKDMGVLVVARRVEDGDFSNNDFLVFRSLAEQSSFAIGNAKVHREAHEKRTMEKELRNAREVQRILLPQVDPVVDGFRISGTNLPARIISGDYYDYIEVAERSFGIVIADVSGKGVPAGLMMAMCRSALRSVAPGEMSPSKALALVNRQLFPDIREDMFISIAYGILDVDTGKLLLSRAGHDPALCYRKATGKVETLRSPGLAVGVDGGQVFERVTRDFEVQLEPGDCVLFYTDGVKEAVDANDEEFGVERMSNAFRNAAPLGAEQVLKHVQEELGKFTGDGPQMDDITLVAMERLAPQA
ncbi:SpoIIE family protein phosphatase [Luteolibacter pohnpeiensis]|uniref:SpoIIE family protein phosphatase n=1 Tax=Luteolibacter pohnpeiensis TaxID=454153 RepID=A0A934S6T7_9BACT|nr:GAF domain-containing SpoIIE family protein phosphatase [Luteolibacter pohnpeiensis]MBK1883706.1 SpoIIE family protein phosphatase [Luteolibacter pohnpeiensis]